MKVDSSVVMTVMSIGIVLAAIASVALHRCNKKLDARLKRLKAREQREYQRLMSRLEREDRQSETPESHQNSPSGWLH